MDRSQIARDLARLRRGRGVSRPDLVTAVGPELREALDVDSGVTSVELQGRLVTLLGEATMLLAPDLGRLAAAAFGLTSREATMSARLALADFQDRDARTWRRRLAQADQMLADQLVAQAQRRRRRMRDGWYWASYRMVVDASGPRPVFTTYRTLVATVDGLDEVQEQITLPSDHELSQVGIEALSGCRHRASESVSAHGWRLSFALPHPLAMGDEHQIGVRFTWPGRDWIQPLAASIPVRTIEQLDVEVFFGSPRECRRSWVLDGALPTAFLDPPRHDQIVEAETVSAHFDAVQRGLLYGIAWEWS